jgi:ribonuclease HII
MDSKKLSEKKREALFEIIKERALAWCVASASPAEIDQLNILHASMLAMKRAVEGLSIQPEFVKVDGNRCPVWSYPCEAIVKGDAKVAEISAASILAKVVRDREMVALHESQPQFGFDQHKGYPPKAHMSAIEQWGVLPEHRRSFKPVAKAINEQS